MFKLVSKTRRDARSGLTLIELLIGLVMTLVVLVAMMRAFRFASTEIARGRALIEMSNQLRIVQENLRSELDGVTVDLRPWATVASPDGYFQYIEGMTRQDASSLATTENAFGDFDDVLSFTTRSDGNRFVGRHAGAMTHSYMAEVAYWCDFDDRDGDGAWDSDEIIKLYRRALVIRPDLPAVPATTTAAAQAYFVLNDVSARWIDTDADNLRDTIIPNSLEDLAKRENRFGHFDITSTGITAYPHILNRVTLKGLELTEANLFPAGGLPALQFEGQDIALADVAGFDLKLFSPNTEIRELDGVTVIPSDLGIAYSPPGPAVPPPMVDQGAYVDLAYGLAFGVGGVFDPSFAAYSTVPTVKSQLDYIYAGARDIVYDTFTKHYEVNGIDDDGVFGIDQGTNGLDDDNANGVDDNGERETMPPYPFRLSGVQISIRLLERTTQQVRQTSITTSFLPN